MILLPRCCMTDNDFRGELLTPVQHYDRLISDLVDVKRTPPWFRDTVLIGIREPHTLERTVEKLREKQLVDVDNIDRVAKQYAAAERIDNAMIAARELLSYGERTGKTSEEVIADVRAQYPAPESVYKLGLMIRFVQDEGFIEETFAELLCEQEDRYQQFNGQSQYSVEDHPALQAMREARQLLKDARTEGNSRQDVVQMLYDRIEEWKAKKPKRNNIRQRDKLERLALERHQHEDTVAYVSRNDLGSMDVLYQA